jgi:hypothetical protein
VLCEDDGRLCEVSAICAVFSVAGKVCFLWLKATELHSLRSGNGGRRRRVGAEGGGACVDVTVSARRAAVCRLCTLHSAVLELLSACQGSNGSQAARVYRACVVNTDYWTVSISWQVRGEECQ